MKTFPTTGVLLIPGDHIRIYIAYILAIVYKIAMNLNDKTVNNLNFYIMRALVFITQCIL